jgi:hypothetical protein
MRISPSSASLRLRYLLSRWSAIVLTTACALICPCIGAPTQSNVDTRQAFVAANPSAGHLAAIGIDYLGASEFFLDASATDLDKGAINTGA